MNILCLDVNLAKCGWAVIDLNGRMIAVDTIATQSVSRKSKVRVADATFERCRELSREIALVITDYDPRGVIMELPSGGAQSQRAAVCMAAGSAICAAVMELYQLPYEAYTPMENKKAATGIRNASKEQMIARAKRQWPDAPWPRTKAKLEDAADAACVWFCAENGTLLNTLRATNAGGGRLDGQE
jgi:Holliday junction resolvasome RuvABC endonuclease subunit